MTGTRQAAPPGLEPRHGSPPAEGLSRQSPLTSARLAGSPTACCPPAHDRSLMSTPHPLHGGSPRWWRPGLAPPTVAETAARIREWASLFTPSCHPHMARTSAGRRIACRSSISSSPVGVSPGRKWFSLPAPRSVAMAANLSNASRTVSVDKSCHLPVADRHRRTLRPTMAATTNSKHPFHDSPLSQAIDGWS